MKLYAFVQVILFGLISALIVCCAATPIVRDATPLTVFQQPIERV